MNNKINRGSEWRKWDLHFHTPASYDYKDKSVTNQQIIDGLFQNEISVIAITDHHVIDIERIKKLQLLGKEKNITVLPGIEFLSDAKGKDPIHFIGIFSETSKIDFIWKQIESRTDIKRIEGEGKHPSEIYCNLTNTINIIKELGGIVSIHAGGKTNSIDNITHSLPHGTAQKEDIAKIIDIFEIGSEEDVEGYNKHVIPYCKKKINKYIPMIICSDNHNINMYEEDVNQNLWIKADPTFEGLKQIIYEPERAKIQKEKPDYKEDKIIIDYVQYIDITNSFTDKIIYFNPNLNVIIGGKSSGKSILLYNIAKTLYPQGTFFKEDELKDKYKEICKNEVSDFEVTIKGGYSQQMYKFRDENSILPDIKYIPQNYLIKLAEPEIHKKSKDILDLVRNLIREDEESKIIYDSFIAKLKENDKKRVELVENYFSIKEEIHLLEDQLKQKRREGILEKNIETNLEKIEEYNKSIGLTDKQREQYKETQEKLDSLNEYIQNLTNDKEKIIRYQQKNAEILQSLKLNYGQFISSLAVESLRNTLIDKKETIEKAIDDIENILKTIINDEDFLENKIEETKNKINDCKGVVSSFLEKESIQTTIKHLEDSISEDRKELTEIHRLHKGIDENNIALRSVKEKLLNFYEDNYSEYPRVLKQLHSRIATLNKDNELVIEGITRFNYKKFQKEMFNISDGRSESYSKYPELFGENLTALSEYSIENLRNGIEKIFNDLVDKKYTLTSKVDVKQATKILFGHYFFDDWEVEYLGDKLKHMSSGKASFVILMLIIGLSKSKTPILIDQPEDNLDNRSISTELVKYLKKKKIERQIILVTHNANIVVNADAENIIVAHQKGQTDNETSSLYRFDYTNGSLENTSPKNKDEKDLLKSMGIREHITDIVEGTEIAFKKRQEKYGF